MSQPKHVRTLKAKRRERVLPPLVKLFKAEEATAKEIGINPVEAGRLRDEGLIKQAGNVLTGQRGRPAIRYRLTDNGRKRVKRALAS